MYRIDLWVIYWCSHNTRRGGTIVQEMFRWYPYWFSQTIHQSWYEHTSLQPTNNLFSYFTRTPRLVQPTNDLHHNDRRCQWSRNWKPETDHRSVRVVGAEGTCPRMKTSRYHEYEHRYSERRARRQIYWFYQWKPNKMMLQSRTHAHTQLAHPKQQLQQNTTQHNKSQALLPNKCCLFFQMAWQQPKVVEYIYFFLHISPLTLPTSS